MESYQGSKDFEAMIWKENKAKVRLAIGAASSSQSIANFLNKRHDWKLISTFFGLMELKGQILKVRIHQAWADGVNIQGFGLDQKSSLPRVKVI